MRSPVKTISALGATTLLLLGAGTALPCGAFFPTTVGSNLAIDAQRALLVFYEREVEMHLQLAANGEGEPFAWILPVPGTPGIALGDARIFDALDAVASPVVELRGGERGGGLCASDAAGTSRLGGAVQHFGSGALGDYEWALIGGTSADAIATWLDTHGFVTPPGLADVIADYQVGGTRFLAVKLAPGANTPARELAPLVITVSRPGDSRVTFPLGFGRLSARALNPVLLYVLSDKRYRVANAGSAEVSIVAGAMRERLDRGEDAGYAATVDALTAAAGGRLFVTEHASELMGRQDLPAALAEHVDEGGPSYLTRLYAHVPAAHLDDLVITFAHEAGDVESRVIAGGGGGAADLALALFGLLVGVGLTRRRAERAWTA